ncbi:hypothetical protein [Streptomyces justiciae]|uniref:hypothetical protein n=1 Tax=Streptomyces justiciae TaxID=2780140 RepID=UPI001881B3BC|nr:hypothetical protein [Streptomyces justiciae]MBE8474149.1 hypothetical protein [Streptomyces justiciae]
MEQRIGSSSKPLEGAGFDPAFIPGLTSPVSGEPEDAKPADAEEPLAEKEAAPEEPETAEEEETEEEAAAEGPVFEASDRRAKIVADAKGVRLSLDEERCEFGWDEIGAVETESPRFGKRFTITVHTPDRRWYPIEIEATARADFKLWEEQLDAVLDEYFEENDDASDD